MPIVQKNPSIAIVGATGIVGTTFLSLFEERSFKYSNLHLVASSRSVGRCLTVSGRDYKVCDLADFDFTGVDIAFFAAGTPISREWVSKAVDQGALVIDNTNAFRMNPDTPLVVPQVNRHLLVERPKSGIIANPNCSTIPLVRLLQPIEESYRVKQVIVSTYQSASGRGVTGIEELKNGCLQIIKTPLEPPKAERFPVALAFNLIPSIDVLLDNHFTLEEQKMLQESQKILNRPDLKVSATCVRVPVINCHSEAVYFECDRDLDRNDIVELLRHAPEVTVYDGEGTQGYPTPRTIDNPDRIHVGRIRIDPNNPKAGWFWLVSDNLRIGAALNAIQIAEEMIQRQVI
ncbi:aspartate-semialdehyde dehydrogenase [Nostoc sp. 'Peltigera malacea cyanobiont' DB3992]|uniref:aspartate-semialdehyde dehydrogenase n=1 Tax=Nostoc sp. 'Peltigera malacea cyanobiont' DB3992 TaxID=1206980 RepID=UPI000C057678|nr:aspartate-semialdehyde dehydrogenase [Nostoc sp. 'Peltigera malacea cyanobiont' DB3992]PHM08716.1 aspartate-semialdehyde dehydrogenase [Nostoc sp. 'Peltigera malacea cyanobiont' DB3992]